MTIMIHYLLQFIYYISSLCTIFQRALIKKCELEIFFYNSRDKIFS